MRKALQLFIAAATYAIAHGTVLAQTSTPNVTSPFTGLATPLTSTTTNCMMACNAQVANCKTACVLPSTPTPTTSGGTGAGTLNASASTACLMNCTSTQLTCQSGCALQSPSR